MSASPHNPAPFYGVLADGSHSFLILTSEFEAVWYRQQCRLIAVGLLASCDCQPRAAHSHEPMLGAAITAFGLDHAPECPQYTPCDTGLNSEHVAFLDGLFMDLPRPGRRLS